ncbi:MAG: hypothetical protein WC372_05865 [Candidatus Neomarinimicrobiota bacterium]|jgi:hypothetical protein|nr:hypothetical protein [Candidatus Neomarinimicrobiota bacterium]
MPVLKDSTKIFDADSAALRELIAERNWEKLIERNKIMCIHDYVKNEIPFGFTSRPLLPASAVLAAGKAAGLNKCILLKTLLDACGILCRWHAFRIKKDLFKGLLLAPAYSLLPETLISAWVEIFFEGQWLVADGVLLDGPYLHGLQKRLPPGAVEFIAYGAGIYLSGNHIDTWNGKQHNYCQRAAIVRDLGIPEDLDWFFEEYRSDIRKLSMILPGYANRVIKKIREQA